MDIIKMDKKKEENLEDDDNSENNENSSNKKDRPHWFGKNEHDPDQKIPDSIKQNSKV